jgi:hypothetical protein
MKVDVTTQLIHRRRDKLFLSWRRTSLYPVCPCWSEPGHSNVGVPIGVPIGLSGQK